MNRSCNEEITTKNAHALSNFYLSEEKENKKEMGQPCLQFLEVQRNVWWKGLINKRREKETDES